MLRLIKQEINSEPPPNIENPQPLRRQAAMIAGIKIHSLTHDKSSKECVTSPKKLFGRSLNKSSKRNQYRSSGSCNDCGETKFIEARGLCGICYHKFRQRNSLNFKVSSKKLRQAPQLNNSAKRNSSTNKRITLENNTGNNRVCQNCKELKRHCAKGFCGQCYNRMTYLAHKQTSKRPKKKAPAIQEELLNSALPSTSNASIFERIQTQHCAIFPSISSASIVEGTQPQHSQNTNVQPRGMPPRFVPITVYEDVIYLSSASEEEN